MHLAAFDAAAIEPNEAALKHPLDLAMTMRAFGAATTSSLPVGKR